MVKQHRKSSSKSKKSKSKTNRRVSRKNMRGGDAGRYVMPPSYFGDVPTGYHAPGAPELAGSANQVSVSQGTVWKGGQYAGPNLYPMQGGDCGCSSKRNYKKKTRKMKGGMKGEEERQARESYKFLESTKGPRLSRRNAAWNRSSREDEMLRKAEEKRIKNMLKNMTKQERKEYLADQERLLREKEDKAKAKKEKDILDQQNWQRFLLTPEGQRQIEQSRAAEAQRLSAMES